MNEKQLSLAVNFLKNKGIISGLFSVDNFSDDKGNFVKVGNGNVFILIKVLFLTQYEQQKPITSNDKSNLAFMASLNGCASSGILVLTLNDTGDDVIQGYFEE